MESMKSQQYFTSRLKTPEKGAKMVMEGSEKSNLM